MAGLVMIWIQISPLWFPLKGIQRLIRVLSFSGVVFFFFYIVIDCLFQFHYSSILLRSTWTPPYLFRLRFQDSLTQTGTIFVG